METLKTILGLLILVNILPVLFGSVSYYTEREFIKDYLTILLFEAAITVIVIAICLGIYLVSGINIFTE